MENNKNFEAFSIEQIGFKKTFASRTTLVKMDNYRTWFMHENGKK